jgi:hypothetical protein
MTLETLQVIFFLYGMLYCNYLPSLGPKLQIYRVAKKTKLTEFIHLVIYSILNNYSCY